jgi:methoxymalonate biosynthesis acyl carrier protein
MSDELRGSVRKFITMHIDHAHLDDGLDLFGAGLATSLFAVQIVMWVERTFGIQVKASDMDIANFSSVDSIAHFITEKRGPGPAPQEPRRIGAM